MKAKKLIKRINKLKKDNWNMGGNITFKILKRLLKGKKNIMK